VKSWDNGEVIGEGTGVSGLAEAGFSSILGTGSVADAICGVDRAEAGVVVVC